MIWRCALLCLLLTLHALPLCAQERLVLLPAEITLSDSAARQTLLVERQQGTQLIGQLTAEVTFESSNPKVVMIEHGVARPTGNGQATITARHQRQTAQATVTVTNFERPFRWSFRNHVESVLAKTGCSSGPCHGAQAGKNGFKISLFGFDPEGDHIALTRQARGRRIVAEDPGRSLLLTKPTGAIPHKGGVRFATDSIEYRVLSEWIAAGAPAPRDDDPRLDHLEILPRGVVLQPGATQQLVLLAHFTDGHTEDVTRWGRYTSTNEAMAQVDGSAQVKVIGHGEGSITGWYLSQVVTASVTSPYPNQIPADTFAKEPRRNFVDEHVLSKLQSLNLPPSPLATDGEFLRRAFLDTIGVLPTAQETQKFLSDNAADKRDRLIEHLLDRSEFVDYWSYKWSDLLLVNSDKLKLASNTDARNSAMWSYYLWIRNQVEANTPWDVFVRNLVTASGSTLDNGAANYFLLHKDPLDQAETTTVAFLGMSINCARCHNHPLEKWTNHQYYAFANLFARVRTKNGGVSGSDVVFVAADGDLIQPLTGKPQRPAPLDGQAIAADSNVDRRQALAAWLTNPSNPYFTRAITNRVWANFFAVGLVESVDDMRLTNPASNEALLNAAAEYLAAQRFDLKALMRTILQSRTYQRSSQPLAGNAQDRRFYARYYPRRLMAEVLLDAMSQVTPAPTPSGNYPPQCRALQLPDSLVASEFLSAFGRPERVTTCECERSSEPSMVQVLNIANGNSKESLNGKLAAKDNQLDQWLKNKTKSEAIVDALYLTSLSRQPTSRERQELVAAINAAAPAELRAVLEDICWSVLSSKEFLFNH